MNDLDSRIAEEIDDEALFRLAEGEEKEFSPEYQQNMERLYRKARFHPKRRMRPIRRIVAIAAIIATLTGAAAAATFWEEIQQFFVTTFGQYAELRVDFAGNPPAQALELIPKDWDNFWYPKELCGYSFMEAKVVGKQRIIIYKKGDEELKFFQWDNRKYINADNDANIVSGIYIAGKEVYAMEKKIDGIFYRTILWTGEDISFKLYGALSFAELSDIGSSLVIVER